MGRNNKTLEKQFESKLYSLRAFGQSRHKDKAEGQTKDKIYSYNTYNTYKEVLRGFTGYLEEIHSVHSINDVTEEMAKDYIKCRELAGYSAYTYSRDMAAINKVLDFKLTKKNCDVAPRAISKITRSRNEVSMDKHVNLDRYKDQIYMAQGTGIRRQSMLNIKAGDFVLNDNGKAVKLVVVEKGGREREINILESHQEGITKIISEKKYDEKIFSEYSKNIDNHSFRSQYANLRIQELEKELSKFSDSKSFLKSHGFDVVAEKPKNHTGKYFLEKDLNKSSKGYRRPALAVLSGDLGHNRIRVCVEHYLR